MAKEFLKVYGMPVAIGLIVTKILTVHMEGVRGYTAVGGELLIVPMIVLAISLARQMEADGFFEILFNPDYDDEEDEDDDI